MVKQNEEAELLTTEQLAARWSLSVGHLELFRMRGKGPKFIKLGDDARSPVRYLITDIVEYEKTHTQRKTIDPKRKLKH